MPRSLIPLVAVGLLLGCNSNPNPAFKQSVEDRASANAGDPYDALNWPPRLSTYSNADAVQRKSVATSSAATLAGNMQSLLDKMKGDQKLVRNAALKSSCEPAINESLEFQANSENGGAASSHAAALFSALTQCRNMAIEQAKTDGDTKAYANLAKRFASSGMALVGISLIAKGDAENGLKIWREGDALIVKDKPGFELSVKSLRGY